MSTKKIMVTITDKEKLNALKVEALMKKTNPTAIVNKLIDQHLQKLILKHSEIIKTMP